jgi:hypothetical protein
MNGYGPNERLEGKCGCKATVIGGIPWVEETCEMHRKLREEKEKLTIMNACGQPDCTNPAEFRFDEDTVSTYNRFCQVHIGEHLHNCNPDYDKHHPFAMKKVTVQYL